MAGNQPPNMQLAAQLGQFTTLVANLAMTVNNLTTVVTVNLAPAAQQQAAAGIALIQGLTAGDNIIDLNMKNGLIQGM